MGKETMHDSEPDLEEGEDSSSPNSLIVLSKADDAGNTLENCPFFVRKVKKMRTIKLFGVYIHALVEEEERVYMPVPLQVVPPPPPRPSVEDDADRKFSQVLRRIEAGFGAPAVFMFNEILTGSDVSRSQNRLFVTTKNSKWMDLLTDKEREKVETDEKGLMISAVDADERRYSRLYMKRWTSVEIVVVKGSDWSKMVRDNGCEAAAGAKVEAWSYRTGSEAELRLAIKFKIVGCGDGASTSGTKKSSAGRGKPRRDGKDGVSV